MNCISIYCCFSSHDEAERISRILLEKRLIACANILQHGQSLYWWKNKIESASECYAFFKTIKGKFSAVEKEILAHHSYETPCILALPIEQGHNPFLDWVKQETT